jgi:hypothetical protein
MPPVRVRRATAPWGAGTLLALVVAFALALTACGRGANDGNGAEGLDRTTFERDLIAREHITAVQARCVTRYTYATYRPAEVRVIHDHGFTALPSPRWTEYAHALVGCLFHDELTPPSQDGHRPASTAPSPPTTSGP